ncbi:ABC transporter [Trametes meyenii]|nr:ABC transporter [Trametes meyenii]
MSSCENYGTSNGTACACPPGFGGSTCSQPACGGTLFQGSSRPLASGSPFANLTSCSCEDGWTGTGCNVCQTAKACQNGFMSVEGTSGSLTGLDSGQNNTLVCSTSPRVYAGSQMSCQVQNPTLQTIFPGQSTLTISRTLNSSFTPLPNVTAFGSSGSVYAQLFYQGVEQFYCTADSCAQDLGSGDGSADWECNNLRCTCRSGTSFCGAVKVTDLTGIINTLSGTLGITCDAPASNNTATCAFKQDTIDQVFGSSGLALNGCTFGECIAQSTLDTLSGNQTTSSGSEHGGSSLSGGVIAGLAVVGGLVGIALVLLLLGLIAQRRARKQGVGALDRSGGVAVAWSDVSYSVPQSADVPWLPRRRRGASDAETQKVILDNVSGRVVPGEVMAILGPSGAGKTTLIEILARKHKSGRITGGISFPGAGDAHPPRIGFVPQQDVLPPMLTVHEALVFAARLRLPEGLPDSEKHARVDDIMDRLGIAHLRDVRIGDGEKRGISGGEMRRVTIGLELVAKPDVLILDEPTSGLDSVSAAKVAKVLHALAHDPENPTAVIASIHQPSSQLYHSFDQVLLLAHGRALYSGAGGFAPAEHFSAQGIPFKEGYNVADYLLDVASDPPVGLFPLSSGSNSGTQVARGDSSDDEIEKGLGGSSSAPAPVLDGKFEGAGQASRNKKSWLGTSQYQATFLTQLEVLSSREWKVLRRDKTLFLAHVVIAAVLGAFCGGLYFHTDQTIAGFQSRVGSLFFLGALIAFSSLSALYNVVEIRPLFLRERSASYYSPAAWLLSRFVFDVVPLRIIPSVIVSTMTYWMAGLAHDAAHFFKFLLILVLYAIAMTLFNFLLACLFRNGGIAILISALTALYQMTYAGFFVHLADIPPVLRWLQWLCPLKYTLEALSVNEVGSGLMIVDSLEGVPVSTSAALIMQKLFGFGENNYYRDVLVLFAYIVGFAVGVIFVVWLKVRERR